MPGISMKKHFPYAGGVIMEGFKDPRVADSNER